MAKIKTSQKLPPIEQLRSRTLGRILIKMGILTREKVHECLKNQKQRKETETAERDCTNRPDIP
jgi:hypothetical protein